MNLGRVRVSAIGIVAGNRTPCLSLPLPACERPFIFLSLPYCAVVNQRAKEEYDEEPY
jgi:hypothetical protein